MENRRCDYEGCQNPAGPAHFVYGRAYCQDHYLLGLQSAFLEEASLLVADNPSRKFRNLFGRYAAGVYSARREVMPEALAGSKLRDRAEDIQYRDNAIIFMIERHPGPVPIQQCWRFDLGDKIFALISEEPSFFDCGQAAEKLGKSPQTVLRYIREGKIRAQRASETLEAEYWFEEKLERGHYGVWAARNRILRPNKWLIPYEELSRFMASDSRDGQT